MLRLFYPLRAVYRIVLNRLRRFLLPWLLRRAQSRFPRIKSLGNVHRLTERAVVKEGEPDAIFSEAANMEFVARYTSIPVPRVYDVWQASATVGYLVIEYIPGQEVRRAWNTLSETQRDTIFVSLRLYMDQLRSIPQTGRPGWIGAADGGPVSDTVLSEQGLYGPFPNESEFNDWRVRSLGFLAERDPSGTVTRELREIRASMADDHRIVFTHGDLNRRNIIVNTRGDALYVGAVIDWTQSGWRPEYWERRKVSFVESGSWARRIENEVLHEKYDAELHWDAQLLLQHGAPIRDDLNHRTPSRSSLPFEVTGVRRCMRFG